MMFFWRCHRAEIHVLVSLSACVATLFEAPSSWSPLSVCVSVASFFFFFFFFFFFSVERSPSLSYYDTTKRFFFFFLVPLNLGFCFLIEFIKKYARERDSLSLSSFFWGVLCECFVRSFDDNKTTTTTTTTTSGRPSLFFFSLRNRF